jgi:hypothetical protein
MHPSYMPNFFPNFKTLAADKVKNKELANNGYTTDNQEKTNSSR